MKNTRVYGFLIKNILFYKIKNYFYKNYLIFKMNYLIKNEKITKNHKKSLFSESSN